MAATAAGKTVHGGRTATDLETDIRQLKSDIEKLTAQLATTGQHGYGAARRVAAQSADQLKTQSGAAIEAMRTNARDMEEQLLAAVREKPVTTLAIAAGVGFFAALLLRR